MILRILCARCGCVLAETRFLPGTRKARWQPRRYPCKCSGRLIVEVELLEDGGTK